MTLSGGINDRLTNRIANEMARPLGAWIIWLGIGAECRANPVHDDLASQINANVDPGITSGEQRECDEERECLAHSDFRISLRFAAYSSGVIILRSKRSLRAFKRSSTEDDAGGLAAGAGADTGVTIGLGGGVKGVGSSADVPPRSLQIDRLISRSALSFR